MSRLRRLSSFLRRPETWHTRALIRFVVMVRAAALFPGCGGSQLPIGAPGAMLQS
jgi:hypothetical protein